MLSLFFCRRENPKQNDRSVDKQQHNAGEAFSWCVWWWCKDDDDFNDDFTQGLPVKIIDRVDVVS